jgi:hypothetical protein
MLNSLDHDSFSNAEVQYFPNNSWNSIGYDYLLTLYKEFKRLPNLTTPRLVRLKELRGMVRKPQVKLEHDLLSRINIDARN